MRRLPIVLILALAAAAIRAQTYPMPGSASEPPVFCTSCPLPYNNRPTFPYGVPIAGFVGRYLDSNSVRLYQTPLRTYRAGKLAIVPELDRIFMIVGGGTFATYQLSTFVDAELGSPMATAANGEKYLPFLSSVYPEAPASGWTILLADGQERLFGFDWDARGYRYLAYSLFGWGIVRDDGTLVSQVFGGGVSPRAIALVRAGSKHYVAVSDGLAATEIYDVTDPASPALVRSLPFAFMNATKVSDGVSDTMALVTPAGLLRIFRASALVAGTAPEADLAPQTGFRFTDVTTDGLRFHALQIGGATGPTSLSMIANENGSWTGAVAPFPDAIAGLTVSLDSGVLAVTGNDPVSFRTTLRLYRIDGSAVQAIDVGGFFQNYYTVQAGGYALPGNAQFMDGAPLFRDGSLLIFAAVAGLGDVYRVAVSRNAPPVLGPIPVDPLPVGTEARFRLSATDAEGSPIRFLALGLPPGATLDPTTGEFVWTPAPGQIGLHSVRFGAVDASGGASSSDVVLVVPPPDASVAGTEAFEGAGGDSAVVTVTVALSTPSGSEVRIDWATADGTATAGEDYLAASGTLVFAPGETVKTIAVTIVGDDEWEPDETFEIILSSPAGATLADERGTITVLSDDAAPIPVLSPWMLGALSVVLAALGAARVKR